MKQVLLIFLLGCSTYCFTQPYLAPAGKTRHRFAQTVFGIELQSFSGGSSAHINEAGLKETFALKSAIAPRIYIGGTHFWGHAEFYFSISLATLNRLYYRDLSYSYSQSDAFGAKIFPWAIQKKKLRPYAGLSVSGINYQQHTSTDNGPKTSLIKVPLLAGINYCTGNYLLDAGISYMHHNQLNYYVDRTTAASIRMPPFTFWFGIKKWLETTTASEKNYLDGTTQKHLESLKRKHQLSSWFVGAGPSSAFYTATSSYNNMLVPFIGKPLAVVFPEASLGYFYEPFGLHTALAARYSSATLKAYNLSQTYRRTALTLESYKYLFDYNGFDPYLGACLSYDWLGFVQHDVNLPAVTIHKQQLSPGLIFGWDILPDKLQGITLRTSLRYFPNLWLAPVPGKKIAFSQLEFNFIQLIIYPQRIRHINREYAGK